MRPAQAAQAGSSGAGMKTRIEDRGWRMEKRGYKATRRERNQTDGRLAKRQNKSLQRSVVAPQRSDGGANPFPIHSASVISATVIDRRYRGSSGRRHEPSKLRWIAVDCGGLRPKKRLFLRHGKKWLNPKGNHPEWITAKYAKYAKKDSPLFAYFAYFAVKKLLL